MQTCALIRECPRGPEEVLHASARRSLEAPPLLSAPSPTCDPCTPYSAPHLDPAGPSPPKKPKLSHGSAETGRRKSAAAAASGAGKDALLPGEGCSDGEAVAPAPVAVKRVAAKTIALKRVAVKPTAVTPVAEEASLQVCHRNTWRALLASPVGYCFVEHTRSLWSSRRLEDNWHRDLLSPPG